MELVLLQLTPMLHHAGSPPLHYRLPITLKQACLMPSTLFHWPACACFLGNTGESGTTPSSTQPSRSWWRDTINTSDPTLTVSPNSMAIWACLHHCLHAEQCRSPYLETWNLCLCFDRGACGHRDEPGRRKHRRHLRDQHGRPTSLITI